MIISSMGEYSSGEDFATVPQLLRKSKRSDAQQPKHVNRLSRDLTRTGRSIGASDSDAKPCRSPRVSISPGTPRFDCWGEPPGPAWLKPNPSLGPLGFCAIYLPQRKLATSLKPVKELDVPLMDHDGSLISGAAASAAARAADPRSTKEGPPAQWFRKSAVLQL